MSNILNLIQKSKQLDPNKSYVLATVLKMDEQSFFKTGTRVIIEEEGSWVGQRLSGRHWGQLTHITREVIASNQSQYLVFDSEILQDLTSGIILGHQGIIHYLTSPLDLSDKNNILNKLAKYFSSRENNILLTLVSEDLPNWTIGETIDLISFKKLKKSAFEPFVLECLEEAILECIINEDSTLKTIKSRCGSDVRFFIEHIKPIPKVIIAT